MHAIAVRTPDEGLTAGGEQLVAFAVLHRCLIGGAKGGDLTGSVPVIQSNLFKDVVMPIIFVGVLKDVGGGHAHPQTPGPGRRLPLQMQ